MKHGSTRVADEPFVVPDPPRGWECPRCHRINAPAVDACPCSLRPSPALATGNDTAYCRHCGQHPSAAGTSACPIGSHYGTFCG